MVRYAPYIGAPRGRLCTVKSPPPDIRSAGRLAVSVVADFLGTCGLSRTLASLMAETSLREADLFPREELASRIGTATSPQRGTGRSTVRGTPSVPPTILHTALKAAAASVAAAPLHPPSRSSAAGVDVDSDPPRWRRQPQSALAIDNGSGVDAFPAPPPALPSLSEIVAHSAVLSATAALANNGAVTTSTAATGASTATVSSSASGVAASSAPPTTHVGGTINAGAAPPSHAPSHSLSWNALPSTAASNASPGELKLPQQSQQPQPHTAAPGSASSPRPAATPLPTTPPDVSAGVDVGVTPTVVSQTSLNGPDGSPTGPADSGGLFRGGATATAVVTATAAAATAANAVGAPQQGAHISSGGASGAHTPGTPVRALPMQLSATAVAVGSPVGTAATASSSLAGTGAAASTADGVGFGPSASATASGGWIDSSPSPRQDEAFASRRVEAAKPLPPLGATAGGTGGASGYRRFNINMPALLIDDDEATDDSGVGGGSTSATAAFADTVATSSTSTSTSARPQIVSPRTSAPRSSGSGSALDAPYDFIAQPYGAESVDDDASRHHMTGATHVSVNFSPSPPGGGATSTSTKASPSAESSQLLSAPSFVPPSSSASSGGPALGLSRSRALGLGGGSVFRQLLSAAGGGSTAAISPDALPAGGSMNPGAAAAAVASPGFVILNPYAVGACAAQQQQVPAAAATPPSPSTPHELTATATSFSHSRRPLVDVGVGSGGAFNFKGSLDGVSSGRLDGNLAAALAAATSAGGPHSASGESSSSSSNASLDASPASKASFPNPNTHQRPALPSDDLLGQPRQSMSTSSGDSDSGSTFLRQSRAALKGVASLRNGGAAPLGATALSLTSSSSGPAGSMYTGRYGASYDDIDASAITSTAGVMPSAGSADMDADVAESGGRITTSIRVAPHVRPEAPTAPSLASPLPTASPPALQMLKFKSIIDGARSSAAAAGSRTSESSSNGADLGGESTATHADGVAARQVVDTPRPPPDAEPDADTPVAEEIVEDEYADDMYDDEF